MTAARPRVALVTSSDWPQLSPDDRFIVPALAGMGVDARITVWTDDRIDWDAYDAIVVRSCWDYHDDLPRWLAWSDAVSKQGVSTRLCNPALALRWNARKTYLTELASRGVPVVPTLWIDVPAIASEQSAAAAIEVALRGVNWDQIVCKPAVSAGALGTLRLDRATLSSASASTTAALRQVLPDWVARGPLMIQPFLSEILSDAGASGRGEWSLMFFDGTFSHAVRKRPAAGDFRVQERHGGSTVADVPSVSLRDVATAVLEAARHAIGLSEVAALLYARVDMVVVSGQPLVMELEITEPALFLTTAGAPGHTAALARAIALRACANRPR